MPLFPLALQLCQSTRSAKLTHYPLEYFLVSEKLVFTGYQYLLDNWFVKKGCCVPPSASEEEELASAAGFWSPDIDVLNCMTKQAHGTQEEAVKPSRSPMLKKIAAATIAMEVPLPDKTRPRKAARQPVKLDLNKPTLFRARSHMPMTQQEIAKILADPRSMPDSDDEEDLDEWKVVSFLKSTRDRQRCGAACNENGVTVSCPLHECRSSS